jgi:hypothetical protein
MVSATDQISWLMSPFCRISPFTLSQIAPLATWPTLLAGEIGAQGADWSNPLPISQGRPSFFASPCTSRRVMSRPTA